MTLTSHEKHTIEKNWNTLIAHLRSFKDLNIYDIDKTNSWLTTVKQALESLIFTHNIISMEGAINIINDAIKQYPDHVTIINDIKTFLTDKQQKIIAAKQQTEQSQTKKIQAREQRKREIELKKQRIKEEEECIKAAKNTIEAYECEKRYWQKLLIDIAQHKDATEEDNINYTNEAIKKVGSLLNPTKPVVVNKLLLEQQLKQEFTNALLQQQKNNEPTVNIYKNIDQFNNALDKMAG